MTNTTKLTFRQQGRFRPLSVTPERARKFAVYSFLACKNSRKLQFRKFTQPCNHPYYKTGSSWTETLGMSINVFKDLRKMLCTHYKTKTEFDTTSDRFKGKPFASYHDKLKKATFYTLNPKYIDMELSEFLDMLGLNPWDRTLESKRLKKITPLYPPKGKKERDYLKKSQKKKTPKQETAHRMMRIWRLTVGGSPFIVRNATVESKFENVLRTYFGNCYQRWGKYCERIARLNRWYDKKGLKISVNLMGSLSDFYLKLKGDEELFIARKYPKKFEYVKGTGPIVKARPAIKEPIFMGALPPMSERLSNVLLSFGNSFGFDKYEMEKLLKS